MKYCEICKIKPALIHKLSGKPRKYCSEQCALKRCHLNRLHDPMRNKKHREQEKERYWKKHGIRSVEDFKCAPKGSGTVTKYGYKRIIMRGHANASKCGAIFEHVFVMSNYLKRPLEKHERIHHKNGNKLDNRIENLELWSISQPYGRRVEDITEWCKEFLEQYGYDVIMKEKKT